LAQVDTKVLNFAVAGSNSQSILGVLGKILGEVRNMHCDDNMIIYESEGASDIGCETMK